jgi:hypothetical protein
MQYGWLIIGVFFVQMAQAARETTTALQGCQLSRACILMPGK